MAAPNLQTAASQCAQHMAAYWLAGLTLPTRFAAFNTDVQAIFPDDGSQASRTVGNWIVIGKQIQAGLPPAASLGAADLNAMVQYVYRICWAGDAANTSTPARITAGQATALLAAYNAHLD